MKLGGFLVSYRMAIFFAKRESIKFREWNNGFVGL
jgi:hypothetical protein